MKVPDGCVVGDGDGDREDEKPDFYGNDESWADRISPVNAGNTASSPEVISLISFFFNWELLRYK